jgi:large subunit ribosomal protein L33
MAGHNPFPIDHSNLRKHLPNTSGLMAGRSKKKAETIFLVCEENGDYNYTLKRKPGGEKLRLKKYSPRLRKHTWHAEKKK